MCNLPVPDHAKEATENLRSHAKLWTLFYCLPTTTTWS
jgi:hypothetical protein